MDEGKHSDYFDGKCVRERERERETEHGSCKRESSDLLSNIIIIIIIISFAPPRSPPQPASSATTWVIYLTLRARPLSP